MKIEQFDSFNGEAIIFKDKVYSYKDLYIKINQYKKDLFDLIENNDVVIIDSDYSFFSICLLFALSEFPCIIVPVVRTTDDEFKSKIISSSANKIASIDDNGLIKLNLINEEVSRFDGYEDITKKSHSGIVLFSSGTTGLPKVMVHNFTKLIESFDLPKKQKSLRFLIFLMFDHIGGLNTLLGCLNNGSPVIIPDSRTPEEILDLIQNQSVQVLPTSPTFLNLMLISEEIHKKNLKSLKMISYGTERMPAELLKKINKLLPNVKLLQTFGTSETGILKTKSKSSSSLFFKIADDEVDYKIIDNQLYIRSKKSIKKYKDLDSNKFTDDGWFATGDIVELDDEDNNYMKITGRINSVINVGGLKVMPAEVEDIINSVYGVIDSTVMAKENSIIGQVVIARVVVDKNFNPIDVKTKIKKACRLNLDKYKRPVKIKIESELKTTSRFKKIKN